MTDKKSGWKEIKPSVRQKIVKKYFWIYRVASLFQKIKMPVNVDLRAGIVICFYVLELYKITFHNLIYGLQTAWNEVRIMIRQKFVKNKSQKIRLIRFVAFAIMSEVTCEYVLIVSSTSCPISWATVLKSSPLAISMVA